MGILSMRRKRPELVLYDEKANVIRSFVQKKVVVGRDARCDYQILPDITMISNEHMQFKYKKGIWRAEDLHSTNGTLVNGTRIQNAVELKAGDRIELASSMVLYFGGKPKNIPYPFNMRENHDMPHSEPEMVTVYAAPPRMSVLYAAPPR